MSRLKIFAGCVIALAMSLLLAQAAFATTYYYIDADAGAGGNGSLSQPWDSIEDLENATVISTLETAAQSDDVTIYVDRRDTFTITGDLNRLYLAFNGTADHWIALNGSSWGGSSPGRAKIYLYDMDDNCGVWIQDGTVTDAGKNAEWNAYMRIVGLEIYSDNTVTHTSILATHNASHVHVIDCIAHGTKNTLQGATDHAYGIRFGAHADSTTIEMNDVKAINCLVYDIASAGIAVYPDWKDQGLVTDDTFTDFEISSCTVYDFGKYFVAGAGIAVLAASDGIVSGNTVFNGSGTENGFGIRLENRPQLAPHDIIVDSNLVYGGSGIELDCGIDLHDADNVRVSNNVLHSLSDRGIRVESGSTGVVVYNNSIYSTENNAIAMSSGATIASLKNNIVYQTANVRAFSMDGTLTEHSNNLFYNPVNTRVAVYNGTSYTYANLATWEATSQNTDPDFVNTGDLPTEARDIAGLAITDTGAAYLNGANLSAIFSNDFSGQTRTTPWDIGAWEVEE